MLGNDSQHSFALAKHLVGRLECGPPDANLSYFDGSIQLGFQSGVEMKCLPLTANQLLLRGCRLRNTAWVLGFVVYTGRETKIQMVSQI